MYRGRGGGLKLDNRPKQLIVRGVPIEDDRQLDQVREWHQETGQADTMTFEENGDIKVGFRTRAAAEQVCYRFSSFSESLKRFSLGSRRFIAFGGAHQGNTGFMAYPVE
jgi:hypothetical protein